MLPNPSIDVGLAGKNVPAIDAPDKQPGTQQRKNIANRDRLSFKPNNWGTMGGTNEINTPLHAPQIMTNSKTNVSFFAGNQSAYCNTPHKNTDGISTFNRPSLSATYAGNTRPIIDNPFKIASTYIEIEGLSPNN
jgi:hypothetical protein